MHDPNRNPPPIVETHIDLDRGGPDVIRAHAVGTTQHVEPTLIAIIIDKDRDARQGRAILPAREMYPSAEHLGRPPGILRTTEEIKVTAGYLRRCDVSTQTIPKLTKPDDDGLSSD